MTILTGTASLEGDRWVFEEGGIVGDPKATLLVLDEAQHKGEGEHRIQARVYKVCSEAGCHEPARYRQTYLLEGTRSNPASSAYGRDDCTWCSDDDAFFCEEHRELGRQRIPEGYVECSRFEGGNRFNHMFLRWETVE